MRNKLISLVADVLAGLGPLVLLVVGDNYLHVFADLRTGVVALSVLYLCAGLARGGGRPENPWLKGLLVSSGGFLALLILGWGQLHHEVLAILLLTVVLFSVCGVSARHVWAARSPAQGAVVVFLPLAAILTAALTIFPALMTEIATQKTSVTAPAFSISKLDGTVLSSSEFRGHVVLVDFWATWCPACRRELPELDKLYRRYKGNSRVVFWAVDVQKNGDTPEKACDFMLKYGYTLPVAVANEKSLEPLGSLNLEGFPSLIVIDQTDRVRLVHSGYDGSEQLQSKLGREIDSLLAERP